MTPEPSSIRSSDNRRMRIWLLIAAILVVALSYGIFRMAKGVSEASRDAVAVSNKFLALQQKHDFDAAYDLCTPEMQSLNSTAKFAKVQALIEQAQGEDAHFGAPVWQYNITNGVTNVKVVYPLQSNSSVGSITIVVVQTEDGWKIFSYYFFLR